MVSMDVDRDKEAASARSTIGSTFPICSRVPGVHAARCIKAEPVFRFNIAGEENEITHQASPARAAQLFLRS